MCKRRFGIKPRNCHCLNVVRLPGLPFSSGNSLDMGGVATELSGKLLGAAQSAADRELCQRQIAATDREIDRLVYELYALSDEEIAIVERENQRRSGKRRWRRITMTTAKGKPTITWLILVYDRTAVQRFPFKRKWYRFSYARATEAQAQEVLRLCGYKCRDDGPSPDTPTHDIRASLRLGGVSWTSKDILSYRHLFDYVPDETSLSAGAEDACAFLNVFLPPESYFEDENEQPISLVQAYDEEAKRKRGEGAISIVPDHPESVLRYGPADPIRPELWRQADHELMMHLWDLYTQLVRSRWLKGDCEVTFISQDNLDAILPVNEDCMAVILPFRQLYSKDPADDLFNRCCNVHSRHCPADHATQKWVKFYQAGFNEFLDQPVGLPRFRSNLNPKRYLDAFAYGARVVHASSKKYEPRTDLEALLRDHPKELVVMGYHWVLIMLLGYVSMVLPVLQQNITHWTDDLGWVKSRTSGPRDLFGA